MESVWIISLLFGLTAVGFALVVAKIPSRQLWLINAIGIVVVGLGFSYYFNRGFQNSESGMQFFVLLICVSAIFVIGAVELIRRRS